MIRSSFCALALTVLVAPVACGGRAANSDSDGAAGSPAGGVTSSGGRGPASAGGPAAAGGDGGVGGAGGDSEGGVSAPVPINSPDKDATGPGNCSDTTLGEFIAAIHELRPDLSDIETIRQPDAPTDSYEEVIPLASAGGFAVAMKRGSGDCPSGCIDSEYWYFDANLNCEPVYAGSYSAIYNSEDNCYEVRGAPSWGLGREVTGASRCDFDPTPLDVSGSYAPEATGTGQLCPSTDSAAWSAPFEFEVTQDPSDPAVATVVFPNMDSRIEGQSWPATVQGGVVHVSFVRSKSSCIDSTEVTFDYDTVSGKGSFHLFEVIPDDCQDPNSDYCKGSVDLTFSH